ncbi:MAG TPA: hypothetical protein PK414_00500 [Anaerolineales bacterium]|nr:hypothetical protein [Anaerolineales bacterium]
MKPVKWSPAGCPAPQQDDLETRPALFPLLGKPFVAYAQFIGMRHAQYCLLTAGEFDYHITCWSNSNPGRMN